MRGRDFTHDNNVTGLYYACVTIKDAGGCDRCPLRNICLEETSYMTVCDELSSGAIDELLDFADDIEQHYNEEDAVAFYADMARKAERDEYYD